MHSSVNLRAAQAVVSSRLRLQSGRSRDAARPLTLRQAEDRFRGSKRATIARIVKKLEAANTLRVEDLPDQQGGRPRLLTEEEEEAIVAFVIWMQRSGLPASKYEVEDAANTLRRRRDPDAKPVSRMWYRRFCDDHPELDKSILKAKEAFRVEYEEAGVEETKQWFQRLSEVITNYELGASECWNADQAGVRVGILRERVECLIVRTQKKSSTEVFSPADRESCTVIGTGNAAGDTTPPWLIFKSFPTLEEYDLPPNHETIEEEGPVWRLLVIDGFTGHGSFAFREYCMKFHILVAFLLPHSTHILQPMDIGVFQYLKNAHQRKLREALRKGKLTFNRRDFAGAFQEIFNEGFTAAHIISGFEKIKVFNGFRNGTTHQGPISRYPQFPNASRTQACSEYCT
ncbi:hypothetical protein AU210_015736 [Fusarium oxysporum f. sp. radicis-cucumerinum]|uniref:HTH CENPB-type domain-containing protein n=1 Tax=Fusarium oxysporum f. sp. radicis-cucumerinum TaxID=327505 RepID=A0A2H3G8B9_FUSOX|nr:hypothetical protein AU210_015736 [Fusarium oxysporum f. sp. radicis-cucumerinum]